MRQRVSRTQIDDVVCMQAGLTYFQSAKWHEPVGVILEGMGMCALHEP